MIAILETRNNFRKAIDFPRYSPVIYVPIFNFPLAYFDETDEVIKPSCDNDKLEFRFDKWLDEKKEIALYKQFDNQCHCCHCRCCKRQ